MEKNFLKCIESNIISWYEFKKDATILYFGDKKDFVYQYLKEKYKKVDIFENDFKKDKRYDYIIYLSSKLESDKFIEFDKYINDTGVVLIAFNNLFGISKFASYDKEKRISSVELMDDSNRISIDVAKKLLNEKGFKYQNDYFPFPDFKNTDIILTTKVNDLSEKIDKYFTKYEDQDVVLFDEIKILKEIIKYDKQLFIRLCNSYLIEVSKTELNTDVEYVSFNNYRKDKYMMATVLKKDIVEKKLINRDAKETMIQIGKNFEFLNQYKDFVFLDRYEDEKIFSEYVKDFSTLDVSLAEKSEDLDYIIYILNNIKTELLKNSFKYDKLKKKELNSVLKEQDDKVLNKMNFLKYAFYDMVPKNCFYIDNKFYFFDQEWMEYNLPVEFIICRSVINSYDLVKNINVDELLQKLGIFEYKNIFEKLDELFRNKIIDYNKYDLLSKKRTMMYEILYDNKILNMQNEQYRINDAKQNEYIKFLECNIKNNK